ncbi:MAG: hypothetical protein FWD71_22965, partial [Oscillospiraceae bacterium]|nr:hypothetical protein [Oscillospiraceae bacterium]
IKKQYRGGLYAACTVPAVTYDNWNLLKEWCQKNDLIEFDWECRVTPPATNQNWVLEEILNYRGETSDNIIPLQIDLLLPIKEKSK